MWNTSPKGFPTRSHDAPSPSPSTSNSPKTEALPNGAARFNGMNQALAIPSNRFKIAREMTLECRFKAESFADRTGLVTKTEGSGYGIFITDGRPQFSIFIGGEYLNALADTPLLKVDTWHDLAGVYDGTEARLYLDGKLVASASRKGKLKDNRFPLIIGGDVNGQGKAESHFTGLIDWVRLSPTALYSGPEMTRATVNKNAIIDLPLDENIGPWHPDASPSKAHARSTGGVMIETID